jgi:hypothetical protein
MSDKEDVTIRAARAQQLMDDEVFNEAMIPFWIRLYQLH